MKEEHEKRRFKIPKKIRVTFYSISIIIILGLLGYAAILIGGKIVVDEADMVLDATTIIETKDGERLSSLYKEDRIPITIEKVPEHVQQAFVAIEDRRFYEHSGVDFRSIMRAIIKDIIAMDKVEGASTITQQLAKNLFLHNDKTWMRKTKEVMAAVYLERTLTKDEILELYMNEIYFGRGVYGIERASNYFFSKKASDLTVSEAALLAGLAKGPNGYSPIDHPKKALERRNVVLKSMEANGAISAEERLKESNKSLDLELEKVNSKPWVDSYVDLVIKEAAEMHDMTIEELKRGGYRIVVNMNDTIQQIAYNHFKNDNYFPGNTKGAQGAFVMMEQGTGRTVAAIGGRDYQLGNLNRTTVSRQPGSTIKPIAVYGPAMMKEDIYTPYTLIPDMKYDYDNNYSVENADHHYDGAVSIYDAIRYSKNSSAVWLLDQIGVPYAKKFLEKQGIKIEDNGLAIALGGLSKGITPINVMESYSSFAGMGKMKNSHTIERIYDKENKLAFEAKTKAKQVYDAQVAWNMTEILQETVKSGTATAGEYTKALAGKTGTTQHPFVEGKVKDAWFAGYTPKYVMTTWMGYDQSDKEHYLNGGSEYPTKLTKAILSELDKQEELEEHFSRPEKVSALPKPVTLPQIENLQASYRFGSFSFVEGELSWKGSSDNRVIYRVYREKEGIDERIGETEGATSYTIKNALFGGNRYYVVPFDPLTKMEGERSNTVKLEW
ncbi:transglycosylase domain-containing protein [Virgibacillus halodenitrificans]|uniref:PBP1A family penicillin-binding protein n=1 Tax=Virgibacillus halodenitrificans TaxID=1482 RepID=A0ABR7VKE5_VIRHA|nr:PBP1A family penicillin-binding protein [Virgibacillus halodenitrificans]MBD1221735.1 PBP1A family penicillin-binding protein [Virgibacillus halodenitrificans]